MAFMVPVATYLLLSDLSYSSETEFCCDACYDMARVGVDLDEDVRFCETCFVPGLYSRLSAPGYLDCTGWIGPFDSRADALRAVMDVFDVDENGEDVG